MVAPSGIAGVINSEREAFPLDGEVDDVVVAEAVVVAGGEDAVAVVDAAAED